ncbi:MAG: hypothetical protein GY829_08330, partial [Gammaproteobacteria bacterium]|nr:hypothetical protein [Gammaproteobacteria bacterium]
SNKDRRRKVAEAAAKYDVHSPTEMAKTVTMLEKKMYEHAKNLEFEDAAAVRDTIEQLREAMLKPSSM